MANNPNAQDNLKPFKKNDTRINRNGRPKSFDALRKLAQQVANEAAIDAATKGPLLVKGHAATEIEMLMRQMMHDNPARFVEIAFGKVPDITEQKGKVEIVVTYRDQSTHSTPGAEDNEE